MTAKQREADMMARWIAERDARLAAMPESELVRRMQDDEMTSGYTANHWSSGATGMYRRELERRRDLLTAALAA